MADLTRKGWTPATLARLGVVTDPTGRYVFVLPTGAVRYADDGRQPKAIADAGTERDLWPAPLDVPGDELVVVEGEPDAVSAAELGLAAVALPGAGKVGDNWPERLAHGRRRVVFVCDADAVGRARMRSMAGKVARHTESVIIDPAPDRTDGYDLGDMLMDLGADRAGAAIRDAIAFAPAVDIEAPAASNGHPVAARTLRDRPAHEIAMRHVEWGFHPYLPLGKVTIIAGAPGQGKSQFTLMIAALVTIGGLPGAFAGTPKDVVIITGEDDPEDTVVPRLLAAGADLRRCRILDVRTADGHTDMLTLPTEGGLLRDYVRTRDIGMVILDPISSFMDPGISTYRNVDVRRALAPLKLMAEERRLISLVVQHLNKGTDAAEPLARITDSGAYVQMARSVLMMGPHPDDDDGDRGARKLLVVAKSNIAPPGDHGLDLALVTTSVQDDAGEVYGTSGITLGDASQYGAEDLFLSTDARGELSRAQAWLIRTLGARWIAREDLDALAKRETVSQSTLRRALAAVGRKRKEQGVPHGRTFWTYKDNDSPAPWEGAGQLDHADISPDPGQVGQVEVQPVQLDQFPGDNGPGQVDPMREYRRQRDAMLGERWEDDDDA